MPEQKPPIRIKLKIGGVEAEIECNEDQLEKAVGQLVSAIQKQSEKLAEISTSVQEVQPPSVVHTGETCKDLIKGLWQEGWFSVSRVLKEVSDELSRRGYNYDRTAVAHTLVDLVREGYLTRSGQPRSYTYIQKRPPA